MRRLLPRVAALTAVLLLVAAASPAPPLIVAFGNSLTAGFGVAPDQAYPARLERKLRAAGYPHRVINAGVSGETTAGGLRRVDRVLQLKPQIVILELGANDGLRGLPLGEVRANLEQIIRRLKAAGCRVVLAGMRLPPNYGPAYTEGFAALYPALARRHQAALIPFFLEGVASRPDLTQPDGLHYATLRLDDGVTFIHIAEEPENGPSELPKLEAFQRFTDGIRDRCDLPPIVKEAREVGSFRMFGLRAPSPDR